MKFNPLVILAVLASAAFVRAQDEPADASRESAVTAVATPTAARILGNIPDGTPPLPAPPKPEYRVLRKSILSSTAQEQGGRTITLQQIKPIDLPPPPQPAEASPAASAEFGKRLAGYRETHPRFGMMFIGATVYRSNDQPPRTLIHVWPESGGDAIELWSSADMALIAGGINTFSDPAGNIRQMFVSWSNVDIDRLSDLFASKGREYSPPEMPKLPEGMATFQIIGKQPAAEDLAAIKSLHDLYNNDYDRLKTAYKGREQARLVQEAELKAHPPKPKDITLNYWRIGSDATATTMKGENAR